MKTAKRKAPVRRSFTNPLFGVERKFFDTETVNDAFAVTWAAMEPATTNLTAVAQGDGESNRDGRKYAITSIHVKGFVSHIEVESSTGPIEDPVIRLCLVHDTQTNGAQLTATDVMDGGQTEDFLAFRNLAFTNRFKVLKDQTFVLPVSQSNTNEGAVNLFAVASNKRQFSWNINFKTPIEVLMSDTGADIANVTDNSLHIIGVASTTNAQLDYQSRIRFVG